MAGVFAFIHFTSVGSKAETPAFASPLNANRYSPCSTMGLRWRREGFAFVNHPAPSLHASGAPRLLEIRISSSGRIGSGLFKHNCFSGETPESRFLRSTATSIAGWRKSGLPPSRRTNV